MSYKNDVNSNFYQIAEWDLNYNITGVNVANLTVTNLANLGSVSNVIITGGAVGQFLQSTGGGVSWTLIPGTSVSGNVASALIADVANTSYSVDGSNVIGTVATASLASLASVATVADTANAVSGSNVIGSVASAVNATVAASANSVAGSNVVGSVANAAHSVISDSANSVAGSNVVGAVAVATLASTAAVANSVAGSNVVGIVSNATHSINSDIALVAYSVDASNIVGIVPNATHAVTSNTVVDSSQPNITSVGTLTSLDVTGNITTSSNIVTDYINGRTSGVTITAAGVNQSITLVPSAGGVINVSGSYIQNVLDPINPSDAATKQYVDNVAQGLYVHETCIAGSTVNINGVYNNGLSGVGATFTPTVALTTLDTVPLIDGNRILLKDQTLQEQNGIYIVTLGGTVLVRANDSDESSDFRGGDFVLVQSGTVNSGTGWILTSDVNIIGTDPVIFQQFSSAGSYTNGTGLNLIGTQFSLSNTIVTPGLYGNATHVGSFTVDQQGRLTNASNVLITPSAFTLSGVTLSPTVVNSSLTSVGTLTSLTATGNITTSSNVNGGGANFTTLRGSLTTNLQPNITSVGTLTNLTVNGISNFGAVSNLRISGGAANTILTSNGLGGVNWQNYVNVSNVTASNTTTANLTTTGISNLNNLSNIRISGGLNGQYIVSNGAGGLSWVSEKSFISNGTSNVNIPTSGGAVTIGVTGTSNVVTITPTQLVSTANITAPYYNGNGFNLVYLNAANIVGIVPDSIEAIHVSGNIQPNITSVGTLTGLTVNGITDLGPNGNITITGGSNNDVLLTDGLGNLRWGQPLLANTIVDGNSNVLVYPNSNINFSINGITDVITFSETTSTFNGNIITIGNVTANNTTFGNLTVSGTSDLGSNTNVIMRGGEFGYLLTTDGNGGLFWKDPCTFGTGGGGGGTIAGVNQIIAGNNISVTPALGTGVVTIDANLEIQPQIEFIAPITAPAQIFTDANIGTFQNSTYAFVSINGVIQRPADYIISGTSVTFINNLNSGDIIQIGPTGGGGAGGSGTVTSVSGTGGGLGFNLSGVVTSSGSLLLTTPSATDLRNNLNIGNVSLINLNGNSSSYLAGDGLWKSLTGAPGGTNSHIQFNNNGTFGGNANLTWDGGNLVGSVKTKALYQTKISMVTNNIDLSLGSFYTRTITGPTTFTLSNIPATGIAASFVLELINGGSSAITWFPNLRWPNGIAPFLTPTGRDSLGFYTHDGGLNWTGLLLGRDIK